MAPAALLTRISIGPPSPSTASGTIRWRSASSARLATMVVTVAPCFSRRAAVSCSDPARFLCFSSVRATMATAAPSAASRSASAAPMPRLAPVTSTRRPANRLIELPGTLSGAGTPESVPRTAAGAAAGRSRPDERGAAVALGHALERLGQLGRRRPHPGRVAVQRLEVEPVDRRHVAGQKLLELDRIGARERPAQRLARVRIAALVVRVVAPPHEPLDADLLAGRGLDRAREADADPAVAGEVLARLHRQHLVGVVLELADPSGLPGLGVEAVELGQHGRDPRAALLGQHEAQTRETLEH